MKSSKNLTPKLLVLIANRQALDPADIGAIAKKILQSRPEIQIFVVDPRDTAEFVPDADWNNPAVSISFGPPGRFIPKRGRLLQNRQIAKVDQHARMKAAGISTPHTERFEFRKKYDTSLFGEFSVLKPLPLALTSHGDTARLYRTHRLTELRYESLPQGHILRSSPCIVQQFIDTGQYPQKWRVLTLFGRPLYCNLSRSFAPRASLEAEDDVIEASIVDAKNEASKSLAGVGERRNVLAIDKEIMNFATNIHSVFPQLPLLGVDILRRIPDGRLFAIELNAGGNVWHFSSYAQRKSKGNRLGGRDAMVAQLGAWDIAAATLIDAVDKYAI